MPVDDDVASSDEVAAAIERFSPADLRRLESAASWRMRGLGGLARGRDADDLLQEAIVATLDPKRRPWHKTKVDLLHHLWMAMRSIADNWGKREDFTQVLESEMHPDDPDCEIEDPLGTAGRQPATQDAQVIADQALTLLSRAVDDDPVASEVLAGMRDGMTGPEIKETLEISEVQLQSARRKIARKAKPLFASMSPPADHRKE